MIKKEHEELLIKELEDLLESSRKKVSTVKSTTIEKKIFCCTIPEVLEEAEEIVKTEVVRLEDITISGDEYGDTYLYWDAVKSKTKKELESDINKYFARNCFGRVYQLLTPIGYVRRHDVCMTIDLYNSMLSKDYVSIIKYYGTRFK